MIVGNGTHEDTLGQSMNCTTSFFHYSSHHYWICGVEPHCPPEEMIDSEQGAITPLSFEVIFLPGWLKKNPLSFNLAMTEVGAKMMRWR